MKENNIAAALATTIIVALSVLGVGVIVWMSAVTLTWLWLWFIVPLGVMQLSLAHAFGISGIVYYLTYRPQTNAVDKEQTFRALGQAALIPFTALGLGYIYQLFM